MATTVLITVSDQYLAEVQTGAAEESEQFLAKALAAERDAKAAADFTLAAKNAMAVALSVEQLLKTRKSAVR